MRSKEEAHDYRYFPDPDLLPLEFDQAYVDDPRRRPAGAAGRQEGALHRRLRPLPYDAGVLAERERAAFFEEVAKGRDGKLAANWVINELFGRLNKEGKDIADSPVSAGSSAASST
jgi:aspartyl-tRNA(Asn)/glutamyl-tRNA(Gln) amidotransferase subunit B